MDIALEVLLGRVLLHIQDVRNNPSRGLNVKLLETIDTLVAGMWRLFSKSQPHFPRERLVLGLSAPGTDIY